MLGLELRTGAGKFDTLMACVEAEADKFFLVFLVFWLDVEEDWNWVDMMFRFEDVIVGRLEVCLITLADEV